MPNKSKNGRSKENNTTDYKKTVIGSAIGTVLFFVFIALFSLASLKSDIFSQSSYMPLGLIAAAVSSFVGGFITVRPVRKNGALLGALTGLVQALLSSALLFFVNNRNSGTGIFILMAVIIVSGAVGGISAVNLNVRKKYK